MSISRKNFLELDKDRKSLKENIIEFLKRNKDKAFTLAEISSELGSKIYSISPYLSLFEKEGKVIHKDNFWTYNLDYKEKTNRLLFRIFSKKKLGGNNMWNNIVKFLEKNKVLELISPSLKGQTFKIEEINDFFVKIKFLSSENMIKIEKNRFLSAYNFLKEKKEEWIKIGASRIGTNPNTLEGRIKQEYDGKMNGLSTASWVATILVKVFDNIKFNGKIKGQALMMK